MADFPVNARFGDVCQFLKGRKPSKVLETKTDGAIPYLLIDSFTNPPSKFTHDLSLPRCTPNDILMVMDGASSGLVAMGVEGAIGSTLAAIKPNSKVPLVPKYLYYWLRHQYDLINRNTRGSAIPHVDRDLLLGLLIPIPSLEIQERIVSILERAEILKQDREQANKLSNGIIQSVFLKKFGHPSTNPKALPSVSVEDVALPKRGAITTGPFGSQLKKSELVDTGVRVLGIENVVNNEFAFREGKFITEEKHLQLSRFTVRPGDVLVTRMGTVGRVAVVPENIGKAIISYHLLRIEPDTSKCHSTFLKYMILTDYVQSQLSQASHGAIMGGLTTQIIKELQIFLPPIEAQVEFSFVVRKMESMKEKQSQSTTEIHELLHSLAHKVFRGELGVDPSQDRMEHTAKLDSHSGNSF